MTFLTVFKIFENFFADNTKVYAAVDRRSDQESLQQDLLKLSEWSRIWLLEFSIQKFKLVQNGNVKYDFEYKLKDKDGKFTSFTFDSKVILVIGSAVVECLTRDLGAAGSSLTRFNPGRPGPL